MAQLLKARLTAKNIYLMCMSVLLVCMCTICMLGLFGCLKRVSDPLELGLWMVVNCRVCGGN